MASRLIWVFIGAGLLLSGLVVGVRWQPTASVSASGGVSPKAPLPEQLLLYQSPQTLPDFALRSERGETLRPAQLQGQWTLAFVGYTQCPDLCPMTLATLVGAVADLQQQVSQPVAIWFISVDPHRDTPLQLQQYAQYFQQPALRAMTTDHPQLLPLTRALGLMYITDESPEHYQVNHSSAIAIINPEGKLVAQVKPLMSAETPVAVVSRRQLLMAWRAIQRP